MNEHNFIMHCINFGVCVVVLVGGGGGGGRGIQEIICPNYNKMFLISISLTY